MNIKNIINTLIVLGVLASLWYSCVMWGGIMYEIDYRSRSLYDLQRNYNEYSEKEKLKIDKDVTYYERAIPFWEQEAEQWKIRILIDLILAALLLAYWFFNIRGFTPVKLLVKLTNSQKTKSVIRFEPLTHSKELLAREEMLIQIEKRGISQPLNIIIEEGGTIIFNENHDVFVEEVML